MRDLRDSFAAAALTGLLCSPDQGYRLSPGGGPAPDEQIAYSAYEIADAMMAERKKRGGNDACVEQ